MFSQPEWLAMFFGRFPDPKLPFAGDLALRSLVIEGLMSNDCHDTQKLLSTSTCFGISPYARFDDNHLR